MASIKDFRKGDWIQTLTGKAFYPLDARPEDFCIEDIAGSLAKQCRFGGHCLRFYSVAEHSVLVAEAIQNRFQLTALLHDASEAYLTDVLRPIKPFLRGYRECEERLMELIAVKFNIFWPLPDQIKRVDAAILAAEAEQNMATPPKEWYLPEPALDTQLRFWSPEKAEAEFLALFHAIS